MRDLTAHRLKRRFLDRVRAFDSPSAPSSGVTAPQKKRKVSSTRRLLPPFAPPTRPRRRPPQRVLKSNGLGLRRRTRSAGVSWKGLSFRMGNLWSWLSRPKDTICRSSSSKRERAPETRNDSHDGLGLEEYRERLVVSQDGYSTDRYSPFGFSPADLTYVTREEEKLHEVRVFNRKVEDPTRTAVKSLLALENGTQAKKPPYKELQKHNTGLGGLEFEVNKENISLFHLAPKTQKEKSNKDLNAPFTPLTEKEENEVRDALCGGGRHEILVKHQASNIEITREILGCLKSRSWLNDDVINLYLELLKEREMRDPERFLKCHFFNTFFYKKLTGQYIDYDFKAVRRWTIQKKLGYTLIECDKIFIPVHKDIHWCLAVINVREKTFQYLDSLGGTDKVLIEVLARYLMDEVKDKNDMQIDTRSWRQESVRNLPLQKNGWDCGMFMLKYIDFYSRGLNLCFSQEDMAYFRKRTAKEILRLRTE